ncbi:LytR/AlgR family response regulator transcription factor [Sporosarcina cyprini]|uniref:LytR/AlgR family response regulator transcription factor n=1 Tax=Sporosarcina cyprini TaxID=2910523 RepID=UPI001EDF18DA|nr:LytTR family DNA-binding domain-containing protein [Sporosarcina cyprini]MCG3086903.1 LytTR family DNA-binding domain-containing protein [Sporosarcina cyprini]
MNRTIRVVVVDDERYAREELAYLLGKHAFIQIVGEADSGEAAIMKAIQLQPDVLFLDVEMPKMSGMEAAKALLGLKKVPLVVFATAYPQFAAEAFRINAVDYLLKPYEEDQVTQTIIRIQEKLMPKESPDLRLGKLAIELDGEIDYIPIQDILYMFRDEKLTKIITTQMEYDVRMTLKELESRLSSYSFFRIHKGYLVNLLHVRRLTPWFNGAYQLEVEGRAEKLSVSRNYVRDLRHRLELT